MRFLKIKSNESMLENFLTNPHNPNFVSILADLVSIAYGIKISMYSLSKNNEKTLNCSYFSNGNTKNVNILKNGENLYIALNEVNQNAISTKRPQKQTAFEGYWSPELKK